MKGLLMGLGRVAEGGVGVGGWGWRGGGCLKVRAHLVNEGGVMNRDTPYRPPHLRGNGDNYGDGGGNGDCDGGGDYNSCNDDDDDYCKSVVMDKFMYSLTAKICPCMCLYVCACVYLRVHLCVYMCVRAYVKSVCACTLCRPPHCLHPSSIGGP
jgi:hypothetical protein